MWELEVLKNRRQVIKIPCERTNAVERLCRTQSPSCISLSNTIYNRIPNNAIEALLKNNNESETLYKIVIQARIGVGLVSEKGI